MQEVRSFELVPSHRLPAGVTRMAVTLGDIAVYPGKMIEVELRARGRCLAVLRHEVGPEFRPLGQ